MDAGFRAEAGLVHLAEGLLPARHVVATAVAAAPFVVWGWSGLANGATRARAQVSMATALLFAVTLFPVPVPVVGLSSHMCATPVLALVLGVRRMVVPTLLVLSMQALLFAHGGLTTLGANLLTLGVVGPSCCVTLARLSRALRVPPLLTVAVAAFTADLAVYAADAWILATVVGGTSAASSVLRSWGALALALAPAQVPLAALEGALSLWLVAALLRRSQVRVPDWLRPAPPGPVRAPAAAALLVAIALSGSAGLVRAGSFEGLDDRVFAAAGQNAGRPPRPLFAFTSTLEDGELGRALFGGAMLVAGFVLGRGYADWRRRRRSEDREEVMT